MKIDISSTMLEKSIDIAKSFLSKLLGPTVEESGLLIRDQVTKWRFNNQVKMLNKAMENCRKNNISPKNISLKLLCPLLDYAGLEDNEELQDKWANLLANMVDSDQNIDNHVFPYLLSQISITEFKTLDDIVKKHIKRVSELMKDLEDFKLNYPKLRNDSQEEIKIIEEEIELRRVHNISGRGEYIPIDGLQTSLKTIKFKLDLLGDQEQVFRTKIRERELVDENMFKEHELGNLVRLGIIKSIPKPYIKTDALKIPNEPDSTFLSVDLNLEIRSDYDDHILTKLGELFILACSEKKKNDIYNVTTT